MKLGINIGCGKNQKRTVDGEIHWINVDADPAVKPDIVASVEYPELWGDSVDDRPFFGQVDEIEAIDILEHIPYSENDKTRWSLVLKKWCDLLRPGGTIRLQFPDQDAVYNQYRRGEISEDTFNRVIYGESTGSLDRHYQLFSTMRVMNELGKLGLIIRAVHKVHVCGFIWAVKPL